MVPTVIGGDFIAEIIKTDASECPIKFLIYSQATIILPTGVEEYCAEGETEVEGQHRLFRDVRALLARRRGPFCNDV